MISSKTAPDMKTKARYRLEGAYAVEWAARAVDVMFGLYGASGLYESGHVARAFRDAHAVKQHFSFNTDIAGTTYTALWYESKGSTEAGPSVTRTWMTDEVPGKLLKAVTRVPAAGKTTTVELVEIRTP